MNPVLLFPLPFLLYFGWLLYAISAPERNLRKNMKGAPTAAPVAEILTPWSEQDRQREALLYLETNAPWLDPDRYGERPDWRHDLLPRQTRGLIDAEKERQALRVNYAIDSTEVNWMPGISVFRPGQTLRGRYTDD